MAACWPHVFPGFVLTFMFIQTFTAYKALSHNESHRSLPLAERRVHPSLHVIGRQMAV